MRKQVSYIPTPEKWESKNDYDSHRPLLFLAACMVHEERLAYEFGCGEGSTPMLMEVIDAFRSYETNFEWFDRFLFTDQVSDYFDVPLKDIALLFVDCAPGEIRAALIEKWANSAEVIVAHDTEPGAEYVYHMAETLESFKYRLDYCPAGKPWATAVSNTVDVTKWVI